MSSDRFMTAPSGQCVSLQAHIPSSWCETNCNHVPRNCPESICSCGKRQLSDNDVTGSLQEKELSLLKQLIMRAVDGGSVDVGDADVDRKRQPAHAQQSVREREEELLARLLNDN